MPDIQPLYVEAKDYLPVRALVRGLQVPERHTHPPGQRPHRRHCPGSDVL